MATVREVPPQRKEPTLKKVAVYCRVSTKDQDQLDNLAAQERYYEERIKANPNWQFAGIYSDIGSGTTIKGRKRLNALHETSEFLLTVICAQAQDESESKSADIKRGLQKSFSDPDSKYYQRRCYGYKHDKNGKLIIDEKEAEVVRLIFRMSREGISLSQISQTL